MNEFEKFRPTLEASIEGITHQGEGIAHTDEGKVVFIPGALPGERVRFFLEMEKRAYARGRVTTVVEPAPLRALPPCRWYSSCGGCQLQHGAYPLQLQLKTEMVRGSLERMGKVAPKEPPLPCVASPKAWGYRNKATFPVQPKASGKGLAMGFYQEKSHRLVKIGSCRIVSPGLNRLYKALSRVLGNSPLEGYDEKTHRGFLHHVLMRETAFSLGITLLVRRPPSGEEKRWIGENLVPLVRSLEKEGHLGVDILEDSGNSLFAQKHHILEGSGVLREALGSRELSFPMHAFFQVNTAQSEQLFRHAASYAATYQPRTIVELYAGVGALTTFLAPEAQKVTGVEFARDSVSYGTKNMRHCGFNHVDFVAADAGNFLENLHEIPDMVYMDPPRKGCEPKVIEELLRINPGNIVYISCNPATLARDLGRLTQGGYRLRSYRPFDMFPQTGHVETVAFLEKIA